MIRTALTTIAGLLAGYLVGAAIGAAFVTLFSQNAHDKNLEVVMTGAFVTGPLGAVIGLFGALLWRWR
ncbi:MAG: hypothetical protein CTY15_11655 [Methylocystis sp.]|nr:MAG: hypothetical protein CTY15_11655 [Methylocystis sp.]